MHFPTQGKKFSISCAFFPIDSFKGEKKKVWQIVIVGIESGPVRFGHDYTDSGATFSF